MKKRTHLAMEMHFQLMFSINSLVVIISSFDQQIKISLRRYKKHPGQYLEFQVSGYTFFPIFLG